jgi:hypothetical protein
VLAFDPHFLGPRVPFQLHQMMAKANMWSIFGGREPDPCFPTRGGVSLVRWLTEEARGNGAPELRRHPSAAV